MPRGQPDYGQFQQKTIGATLSDMADLAVRLGSIVEYDRRGDIVFLDDFENTILKWIVTPIGASTGVLDSTYARSGSQSLKLHAAVGVGSQITIDKGFSALGTPRGGVKLSLCNISAGLDFYLRLHSWDGTNGYRARILYDASLTSFFVEDTVAATWTLIANVGAMQTAFNVFYPMKLVADFTAQRYVRFLFAGAEYDLSAIVIPPVALLGAPYYVANFQLYNPGVAAGDAWVDDFVLTLNEP